MNQTPYKIHLVTFGTMKYFHRQKLLGLSAKLNRVVDTVTDWSPKKLIAAGFKERVKDIRLEERGSGYWSWKPFIILERLNQVSDGDMVFYCDVGRRYPFTLLDQPITAFIEWIDSIGQDMMPGVENTWDGPVCYWTKRKALISLEMDKPEVYNSTIIQAGFSFWRAGAISRNFIRKWMDLCSQRDLISDDPSPFGSPEIPEFCEHRHDQSLLTLLCLKEGILGMRFTEDRPMFQSGNPSEVSKYKFCKHNISFTGKLFNLLIASPIEQTEKMIRNKIIS